MWNAGIAVSDFVLCDLGEVSEETKKNQILKAELSKMRVSAIL